MRGIVTLCGSTRFRDLFEKANAELTAAGWAVLSVGMLDRARFHNETDPESVALKAGLDALHLAKIDMSQAVVVLNGTLENERHPDTGAAGTFRAYIGDSTKREVAHAREGGKAVYWWDLKGAMVKLVERDEGPAADRQPWDWDGGDRMWTDLLEPARAAQFMTEAESEEPEPEQETL